MAKINLGRVVGYSAYEVALQNGYVGTEAEWVASLKGKDGKDGETGPKGPAGADYVITNADYEAIANIAAGKVNLNEYVNWNGLENRLQAFEMGYGVGMGPGGSGGGMGEGSGSGSEVGYSLDQGQGGTGESSGGSGSAMNPLYQRGFFPIWVESNGGWYSPDTTDHNYVSWLEDIRSALSQYADGTTFTFIFQRNNTMFDIGMYSPHELLDNDFQLSKSGMGPGGDWQISVDLKNEVKKFNINSPMAHHLNGELPETLVLEIWPQNGGGSSGGEENHIVRKNEFYGNIGAFVNEDRVRAIVTEMLGSIANAEEGAF